MSPPLRSTQLSCSGSPNGALSIKTCGEATKARGHLDYNYSWPLKTVGIGGTDPCRAKNVYNSDSSEVCITTGDPSHTRLQTVFSTWGWEWENTVSVQGWWNPLMDGKRKDMRDNCIYGKKNNNPSVKWISSNCVVQGQLCWDFVRTIWVWVWARSLTLKLSEDPWGQLLLCWWGASSWNGRSVSSCICSVATCSSNRQHSVCAGGWRSALGWLPFLLKCLLV